MKGTSRPSVEAKRAAGWCEAAETPKPNSPRAAGRTCASMSSPDGFPPLKGSGLRASALRWMQRGSEPSEGRRSSPQVEWYRGLASVSKRDGGFCFLTRISKAVSTTALKSAVNPHLAGDWNSPRRLRRHPSLSPKRGAGGEFTSIIRVQPNRCTTSWDPAPIP